MGYSDVHIVEYLITHDKGGLNRICLANLP